MAMTLFTPSTHDVFGRLFEDFMTPLASSGRAGAFVQAPQADVMETEDEIRVMLELPGMRRDDISVELENNVLTVSGEKRMERTEGGERDRWHVAERRWGRFSRSFVLPAEVEDDRVSARYEDGILYLAIPKSEKARRRRIEIEGGGAGPSRQVESTTGSGS